MSREGLQRAIAALDDQVSCTGTVALDGPLSITFPNGRGSSTDDPRFVEWLIEHGEAAPFGDLRDRQTKVDLSVRQAIRLVPRGAVHIGGFDPSQILPVIEQTLSPRSQLTARLTDVVVYLPGGHFAPHKDTPHSPELIGTLVVCLPIEHTGGAFHVGRETIDWSGPVAPSQLRWVALFSDADHAVMPVTAGARVTLVYSLLNTRLERKDLEWRRRLADVERELADLQMPFLGPLVIPCAHEVIGLDDPQPLPLSALRGVDHDLAELLREHGFDVTVHACLAAREVERENPPPTTTEWDMAAPELYFAALRRPFTDADAAGLLEAVTFVPASCDGGGYLEDETSDLSDRVDEVFTENWLLRPASLATFIAKRDFSHYGLVGNDAPESYLYKLAAIAVTRKSGA